jgi:predicted metal-dependent HD superfamily phosphohydrolase
MIGNTQKINWKPLSYKNRIKVFSFIYELFNSKFSSKHAFHNWNHTCKVVIGVREISESMNLSEEEKEIVILAAWFHDAGHIYKCYGHEEESKKIAYDYLLKNNYPKEKVKKVLVCIGSTKFPQSPKDILGQVLCDGDLYHLSMSNYLEDLQKLRDEWALISNINFSDRKWIETNLTFLKSHQYFTKYGKENLGKEKQKNIELLESLRLELNKN